MLICHPKKKDLVLDTIYTRKDERYIPILKEVIEMDYLSTKRPKISMIARKIETKCTQAKLDPIDYDTVAKLIGRIDKQIRERMRDGRAAAQKYNPVQRGWTRKVPTQKKKGLKLPTIRKLFYLRMQQKTKFNPHMKPW